jgi:tetratricopeptide (TPR) repeat protein
VRGNWPAAHAHADGFIASCASTPHYMESPNRGIRAAIRLAKGDRAGALEDARAAEDLGREIGDPQVVLPALLLRARVHMETGDRAGAEAMLDELLEAGPKALCSDGWLVQLPPVLLTLGRTPDYLNAPGGLLQTPWLEAMLAVAAGNWQRGAEILDSVGTPGDAADVRRVGAEVLLRDGRRREAEALLPPALRFYESVGATARVQAGRALLAASA